MCKALQDWYDEALEIGRGEGVNQNGAVSLAAPFQILILF